MNIYKKEDDDRLPTYRDYLNKYPKNKPSKVLIGVIISILIYLISMLLLLIN